jgi:hypothetical protein
MLDEKAWWSNPISSLSWTMDLFRYLNSTSASWTWIVVGLETYDYVGRVDHPKFAHGNSNPSIGWFDVAHVLCPMEDDDDVTSC